MCGIRTGRRMYYVNHEAEGSTRIEAANIQEGADGLRVTRVTVAGVTTGFLKDLAIAVDGRHLLAVDHEGSLNLTRAPLSASGDHLGGSEEELSDGLVRDRYPAVSPDSRRIVVGSNRTGQEQLWVVDTGTRRWEHVEMPAIAGGSISAQACWRHDNRRLIAMRYLENGTKAFWQVALDGSAVEQFSAQARPESDGSVRHLTRRSFHALHGSRRRVQPYSCSISRLVVSAS